MHSGAQELQSSVRGSIHAVKARHAHRRRLCRRVVRFCGRREPRLRSGRAGTCIARERACRIRCGIAGEALSVVAAVTQPHASEHFTGHPGLRVNGVWLAWSPFAQRGGLGWPARPRRVSARWRSVRSRRHPVPRAALAHMAAVAAKNERALAWMSRRSRHITEGLTNPSKTRAAPDTRRCSSLVSRHYVKGGR
jgi:hypothetical protein